MKNYHEILGISSNASKEDIRQAFKKLASIHHPDRGGNNETYRQILEAYKELIAAQHPPLSKNAIQDHLEKLRRREFLKKQRDKMFRV